MPLQQSLSLLLLAVLNRIGYKESYTWEERTAIREWLKESTVLNRYFPYHFPLLDGLRNKQQQAKYSLETEQYLKKLGINTSLDISNDSLIYNGVKMKMSDREFNLFKLLYNNRGNLVDYDTIYSEVWGDNLDNFSLYSISKLVERVRKKLEVSNVSKDLIQAYKGRGYYIS